MKAIGIKVDGEWLDLEGVKIRLHADSQLFTRSFVQNWYSFPVALPWTDRNARLMRHYERVNNYADLEEIPCEIHLGGLFWKQASIVYTGYKGGRYDIDLQVPPDPVITYLSERRLSSFDYDGPYSFAHFPDDDLAGFNDLFNDRMGTIDDTPFIFAPIRNENKFGGRENTYFDALIGTPPNDDIQPASNYLNYYDPALTEEWFYYDVGVPAIEFWINDFTPLPYLAFIIEHIAKTFDWQLMGDVFENEEVRKQVVVSNAYMLLMVENSGSLVVDNVTYTDLQLGTCMPDLTCTELITKLMARYNAAPIWAGGNTLIFKSLKAVIADVTFLDVSDRIDPDIEILIDEQGDFALTQESDDLDKFLENNPGFNSDRLIATVDTFADLSGLSPIEGDLAIVLNQGAIFEYRFTLGGTAWSFFSHYTYDYREGVDPQEQSAGVMLTAMYRGEDEINGSRSWLVPQVAAPISDHMGNWHNMGIKDLTHLRLLYYRGLQPDSNNDDYPLLTNGTQDYNGDAITDASMTERLEGDGGIYDEWYSMPRSSLAKSRRARARVMLGIADLLTFDFSKKLRAQGTNWLPTSFDVEIDQDGISPVLIEMLSI